MNIYSFLYRNYLGELVSFSVFYDVLPLFLTVFSLLCNVLSYRPTPIDESTLSGAALSDSLSVAGAEVVFGPF